jgi:predicted acyltransferase (DUF342 family)
MTLWAPLALTTTTAALLAVPIAPALYELHKRRDAAPLPTSRHDGRIANFADVFRSSVEPLLPQLAQCHTNRSVSRTNIAGMEVLLSGCESLDFDPRSLKGVSAIMCSDYTAIPAGRIVETDVYVDGSLDLGSDAALRAAISTGDIVLGKKSVVLRWLHADGSIFMRQGSISYGRLSAKHSISLERGCAFQRMQAPEILTIDPDKGISQFVASKPHLCQTDAEAAHPVADLNEVCAISRPRIRIRGNFFLPAGETLNSNVVATGEIRVGRGAHFLGSAKSYKSIVVEEGACVHGSIVCGNTVRLGPGSYAAGPIMAEGEVVMERGTCLGAPDALTTLSSRGARIAAGCQLHGTVWIRVQGYVEG